MIDQLKNDEYDFSKDNIIDKANILHRFQCNIDQIIHIINTNNSILNKTNMEINKILNYLHEKGFTYLNDLIYSNPYILDLEQYEVDNYIDNRVRKGELLSDIIDDLSSNSYLFDEM